MKMEAKELRTYFPRNATSSRRVRSESYDCVHDLPERIAAEAPRLFGTRHSRGVLRLFRECFQSSEFISSIDCDNQVESPTVDNGITRRLFHLHEVGDELIRFAAQPK